MNDLIKEIEELKNKGGWTNDSFYHCAINDTIRVLNQHNIITAPKSIKLSEIVSRLNDCRVERYNDYISLYEYHIPLGFEETIRSYYLVIKNNKIIEVILPRVEDFKWLYTLWIAGSEIIDDMEE